MLLISSARVCAIEQGKVYLSPARAPDAGIKNRSVTRMNRLVTLLFNCLYLYISFTLQIRDK